MRRFVLGLALPLLFQAAGSCLIWAMDVVDEFEEPVLNEAWTWSAHPAITYSLTLNGGCLSVDIPDDRPYDIWSNNVYDGMLLLRHDQGEGDWLAETRFRVKARGDGFQVGLVVWSNPYAMYFWTLERGVNKKNFKLSGEPLGITDFNSIKKSQGIDIDNEVVLRVEKIHKTLQLQYWDAETQTFETYETYNFKFPVNGVGLAARTFSPKGARLNITFDYFKLVK